MKNWSIKLMVALVITVIASVVTTGLVKLFHVDFWNYAFTIVVSLIIAALVLKYVVKAVGTFQMGLLMGLVPAAVCFPANNWLYYSADETVHFETINELVAAEEKPLYFTLGTYYWDIDGQGVANITRTTKRRGRESTTVRTYMVLPLYPDTTTTEVKVWLAHDMEVSDYDAAEDYDEIFQTEKILNFELLTEDLADYQTAAGYSDYKDLAKNALFITPLYKEYITSTSWAIYFLISLAGGAAIMALIGVGYAARERKLLLKQAAEEQAAEQAQQQTEV